MMVYGGNECVDEEIERVKKIVWICAVQLGKLYPWVREIEISTRLKKKKSELKLEILRSFVYGILRDKSEV